MLFKPKDRFLFNLGCINPQETITSTLTTKVKKKKKKEEEEENYKIITF